MSRLDLFVTIRFTLRCFVGLLPVNRLRLVLVRLRSLRRVVRCVRLIEGVAWLCVGYPLVVRVGYVIAAVTMWC